MQKGMQFYENLKKTDDALKIDLWQNTEGKEKGAKSSILKPLRSEGKKKGWGTKPFEEGTLKSDFQ